MVKEFKARQNAPEVLAYITDAEAKMLKKEPGGQADPKSAIPSYDSFDEKVVQTWLIQEY